MSTWQPLAVLIHDCPAPKELEASPGACGSRRQLPHQRLQVDRPHAMLPLSPFFPPRHLCTTMYFFRPAWPPVASIPIKAYAHPPPSSSRCAPATCLWSFTQYKEARTKAYGREAPARDGKKAEQIYGEGMHTGHQKAASCHTLGNDNVRGEATNITPQKILQEQGACNQKG